MALKILFVCVGNTCRSQMAEGFAKRHGGEKVEVRSAGTSASGYLNRSTVEAMKEAGIDISGQSSDQLADEHIRWADVVVTMGSAPADEICPDWFKGRKYDWMIEDPLGRPWDVMQRVRNDIEKRVRELIIAECERVQDSCR
ncbi:MAG: arsenate reductase ArsC [Deltaproteobacteria bacterium]|nr:arsenate reductase ArsC [Deltaproteobacteria bacterium]MBZ0219758.1 arsenate reductase ArsC [Deltaproteobacteria bacterium]